MKKMVALICLTAFLGGINCSKNKTKDNESDSKTVKSELLSPIGTWKLDDQVFQIEINFYNGGIYSYSDNIGSSMGKWTQDGNNIRLVDNEDGLIKKCWLMSESSMGLSNVGVLHKK